MFSTIYSSPALPSRPYLYTGPDSAAEQAARRAEELHREYRARGFKWPHKGERLAGMDPARAEAYRALRAAQHQARRLAGKLPPPRSQRYVDMAPERAARVREYHRRHYSQWQAMEPLEARELRLAIRRAQSRVRPRPEQPAPLPGQDRAALAGLYAKRVAISRRLKAHLMEQAGADEYRQLEARTIARANRALAGIDRAGMVSALGMHRREALEILRPVLAALGLKWSRVLEDWHVVPRELHRHDLRDLDERAAATCADNLQVVPVGVRELIESGWQECAS